jgi:spore coat protein CotH
VDARDSIASATDAASVAADGLADNSAAQAKIKAGVAKIYDTTFLHKIDIVVAAKDVAAIERKSGTRVPCTFTYDGITLQNVGVRQAGGSFNPSKKINDKPSLSVKFDEFVKNQELHDIEKIVLKNELQDLSLVNEHMTYEIYRRAGLAAPTTAHAVVTINGLLNGIYLMREPINKQFIVRNLGKGLENGNLYEEDFFNGGDFVNSPMGIQLKNEKEEMRSRADIVALASAMKAATPTTFVGTISPLFDVDRYVTYYAVEAVTSYFDGFSMHNNNTYMYDNPKDGRFILFPHGADESFWATGTAITRIMSATQSAGSTTGKKLRAVPELDARWKAEIARIGAAPVWDQTALLARVEQVAKIFATATSTGRTATDLALFDKHRPIIEAFIKAGGTSMGTATLPVLPMPR